MAGIADIVKQFGTSLEETRALMASMGAQMSHAVEGRQFTEDMFLGAEEALEYGVELDAGWQIKLSPDTSERGFAVSYLNPEGWEITELGDYVSPEGEVFTEQQLSAMTMTEQPSVPLPPFAPWMEEPVAPEAIPEGYPGSIWGPEQEGYSPEDERFWYEKPGVIPFGIQGAEPGPEFYLAEWENIQDAFTSVFTIEDIETIITRAEQDPELLYMEIVVRGRNEGTENLMRLMFPDIKESELEEIFSASSRAEAARILAEDRGIPTLIGPEMPVLTMQDLAWAAAGIGSFVEKYLDRPWEQMYLYIRA
ncbi:MAG: hypothetical protein KAT35_04095, partial [Candidatus Aenigmarchaeota archaeon]|nr:hypothetical protein [Candidatus Aenigmarchaeota archaeon]